VDIRLADSVTQNQTLIQAAFDGLNWAESGLAAFDTQLGRAEVGID
jgi:hypothetical protein